jgi:import inner membrane translocase subunit TIM50
LNKFFEVVIYTDYPGNLAEPVLAAVDQIGLVHYRLYREHHRLEKSTHLKDLEFLNRDLSRVVVLETDMQRVATHPENALQIKPWFGTSGDDELYKILRTLQG